MMRFWKKNEKLATILKSLLVMYILTGVLLLILAFLLYKFSLPQKAIGIGILVIYIGCTFLGGMILGKVMKVKKYLWGLLGGSMYFFILVILSLIFNGGIANLSGNFLLTLILCGGSGMLGGMLS